MDPRVAGGETRADAREEFDTHVAARRAAAGVDGDALGSWGLALSGGGIRSATFCLGLVRGLAKTGLLKQFDYLSTVSGGGYLGASLGRLYGAAADARAVEAGIARDDSMWLWWLRNNGRYLTPAGSRDLGYATASIVRGVIATHLEIGVLIVAMACLVLLPHVVAAVYPPLGDTAFWNLHLVGAMPSVWCWLLLAPAFACVHQVCAYWYTRDRPGLVSIGLTLFVAAASCAFAVVAMREGLARSSAWTCILGILGAAPATAAFGCLYQVARGMPASTQRLVRTKRLSYGLWGLAIVAALILLDWGTWQLTRLVMKSSLAEAYYKLCAAIVAVAAIGRLVLPALQRWLEASKGPRLNLQRMLNVLGIALAVLVAVLWTTALRIWLFPDEQRTRYEPVDWTLVSGAHPLNLLLAVLLVCLAYLFATRGSFDLLNLASLHNFYRARIERAYVSSGNGGADARFPGSALDPVDPAATLHVAPLIEAIPGDDVELQHYRPHVHGGPIHLVNCCINQSVDDRTGLYNADRKGVALTVSALGVEAGTRLPEPDGAPAPPGRLSQWVAISGAAASTGMGSRTSMGFAALLFMSGIRLGYWMPSLVRDAGGEASRSWRANLLRACPKPFATVAESIGRFPGLFAPLWYLSDGGHFDNTGVYALLKRRARLIVAADCGADPKYLFGDLESLVRKAKIDYGATIEFVDDEGRLLPHELRDVLGTPETIGPEPGNRWLVLGRICYADGSEGTLLVVKPRRLEGMPFDMVAYADRNPDYPQQTTGDQFFDESQWESYHQLGLLMGARLTPAMVEQARQVVRDLDHADSSLRKAQAQQVRPDPAAAPSRGMRAGLTVGATVGAGLSLSALFALWQGFAQVRETWREDQRRYDAMVADLYQKIDAGQTGALFHGLFVPVAEESRARGDDRFETLLRRLNLKCNEQADEAVRGECMALHAGLGGLLVKDPDPFYDYWFRDKCEAYAEAHALPEGAVCGGGMPAAAPQPALAEAAGADQAMAMAEPVPAPPPPAPSPVDDAGDEASAGAVAQDQAPTPGAIPPPPSATGVVAPAPAATHQDDASVRVDATSGAGSPHEDGASGDLPAHAAAQPPPAEAPGACAPDVRLYVHIYDEDSRTHARALGEAVMTSVGAAAAPVENVAASARRAGRSAPYAWSRTTLVYPAGTAEACVRRAREAVGAGLDTQRIRFGRPNSLELWIPPGRRGEGAAAE